MGRYSLIRCLFPFLSIVVLTGFSNAEQAEVSRSSDGGAGGALRLVIRWGGDDLASRQDLALRNKIERLIEERDIGRVLRSGTGMGWMDIWIRVKDKKEAKKALEGVMGEVAPHIDYSIAFPNPPPRSPQP